MLSGVRLVNLRGNAPWLTWVNPALHVAPSWWTRMGRDYGRPCRVKRTSWRWFHFNRPPSLPSFCASQMSKWAQRFAFYFTLKQIVAVLHGAVNKGLKMYEMSPSQQKSDPLKSNASLCTEDKCEVVFWAWQVKHTIFLEFKWFKSRSLSLLTRINTEKSTSPRSIENTELCLNLKV